MHSFKRPWNSWNVIHSPERGKQRTLVFNAKCFRCRSRALENINGTKLQRNSRNVLEVNNAKLGLYLLLQTTALTPNGGHFFKSKLRHIHISFLFLEWSMIRYLLIKYSYQVSIYKMWPGATQNGVNLKMHSAFQLYSPLFSPLKLALIKIFTSD